LAIQESLVVILDIHQHPQIQLLDVAQAGSRTGLVPRLGKDREQDRGQDGDDGDDDKQFDQGETTVSSHSAPPMLTESRLRNLPCSSTKEHPRLEVEDVVVPGCRAVREWLLAGRFAASPAVPCFARTVSLSGPHPVAYGCCTPVVSLLSTFHI